MTIRIWYVVVVVVVVVLVVVVVVVVVVERITHAECCEYRFKFLRLEFSQHT